MAKRPRTASKVGTSKGNTVTQGRVALTAKTRLAVYGVQDSEVGWFVEDRLSKRLLDAIRGAAGIVNDSRLEVFVRHEYPDGYTSRQVRRGQFDREVLAQLQHEAIKRGVKDRAAWPTFADANRRVGEIVAQVKWVLLSEQQAGWDAMVLGGPPLSWTPFGHRREMVSDSPRVEQALFIADNFLHSLHEFRISKYPASEHGHETRKPVKGDVMVATAKQGWYCAVRRLPEDSAWKPRYTHVLTQAGMVAALWAVMVERLRSMFLAASAPIERASLVRLSGFVSAPPMPFEWNAADSDGMERLREELLRHGPLWPTEDSVNRPPTDRLPPSPTFSESSETPVPSLTPSMRAVMKCMANSDPSHLLPMHEIESNMERPHLAARTIGPIVKKLICLNFAERPEGPHSGARLTPAGRREARKIAD